MNLSDYDLCVGCFRYFCVRKNVMMLNYLHKILEKALLLVLAFGVVACSEGITITDLRNGDLLFVVNGQGNNITDVTDGWMDLESIISRFSQTGTSLRLFRNMELWKTRWKVFWSD